MYTFLDPPDDHLPLLPLEHLVILEDFDIDFEAAPHLEFDASPWGFGGLLRQNGKVVKYFYGCWTADEEKKLDVKIGEPHGQTTWEYLTLFLALVLFGYRYRVSGIIITGDNIASLNLALTLKGDKSLNLISREMAWRRVRHGWRYRCAHLPSELNKTADELSRLSRGQQLPDEVRGTEFVRTPRVAALWTSG